MGPVKSYYHVGIWYISRMLWHIRRYAVAYPKNNGIDLELTIASVRELIANCVHGKIARQAVPPLCGRTDEGIRFRRHRDSAGSRFIALAHAIIAAERGLVAFVITNRVKLLRSMSTRYQKDNRRKSIPQLPARTLSLSLSLSLSLCFPSSVFSEGTYRTPLSTWPVTS